MLSRKKIDEIVVIDSSDNSPQSIVDNFITQQKKYGNAVSVNQKKNIETLATLLYYPNKEDYKKVPIVANVPMGEGKSQLLIEFLKHAYQNDPHFGAVVVKKTLEECHDFCIDLGLADKDLQENRFGEDRDSLKKAYESKNEKFIAHTVRGFNFEDCPHYKDINKHESFGKPKLEFVEYDYRLCNGCHKPCSAKKSKSECVDYRVIAISHTRLFLSNDMKNLFDDIMYFNNGEKKVQRKLLIIDEKIDMCDVPNIRVRDFKKLQDIIEDKYCQYEELFQIIEDYINSLDYPIKKTDSIIKQTKVFNENGDFQFDEELSKLFYRNTSIKRRIYESLYKLGKILNSNNITTGIHYNPFVKSEDIDKEREIFAYRYLNLADYSKRFEKTLIFDATARLDDDYLKSDAVLCESIVNEKREINVFIPKWNANSSKSKLQDAIEENINNLVEECENIMESDEKKTLIVVYKDIKDKIDFDFKDEIIHKLDKECEGKGKYEVIHHGQYTTGVNKYLDFQRIIIIGQLNKGSNFYQNKCLAVGRDFGEDKIELKSVSRTQVNDYLISNIQQIGRTAFRQKKLVDVFFFDRLDIINTLTIELRNYFSVRKKEYNNNHYCYLPNEKNADRLIANIPEIFKGRKMGDTIPKKDFRKLCNEKYKMEECTFKRNKDTLKQAGIEEDGKFHYKFTKDFL